MKVLLRAALDHTITDPTVDGSGLASALLRAGADVHLDPTFVQAPLAEPVAKLFAKQPDPPYDLLLHIGDPRAMGINGISGVDANIKVAWTSWPLSSFDTVRGRSTLRQRLTAYDLVIGADGITTAALEPYITQPTATVQPGFWPDQWPAVRRNWRDETLRFCMAGSMDVRTDPLVAMEAYAELLHERPDMKIALNVKTVAGGFSTSSIPGLTIYDEQWPDFMLRTFFAAQHVLLAPSRGEGLNCTAVQFMSTGGAVIATNWGGNTQWLSPAYAYPLDYTLVPVSPEAPACLWAKADKAHLKTLMRQAYDNRAELERRANAAAQLIPEMCAWPRVLDRLFTRIADAIPGRGERLLHASRVAKVDADRNRSVPL